MNYYNNGKNYNKVFITGKIVHKYVIAPNRVILTIHTGGRDFPKVFALDKAAEYIIAKCPENSYVKIEGNIQSSKKPKVAGIVTSIFVDSVKRCSSSTPPENKFFLSGEITSVRTFPNDITKIIVKTRVNNHISTVPVCFYQPHHLLSSLADNYDLSISGKVQTVKKIYQSGSVKMYHQNYVANFPKADFNE